LNKKGDLWVFFFPSTPGMLPRTSEYSHFKKKVLVIVTVFTAILRHAHSQHQALLFPLVKETNAKSHIKMWLQQNPVALCL